MYEFRFVIEEISNINDKAQSMMVHMYFAVMWKEPRLVINESAVEWDEDRTGPKDVSEVGLSLRVTQDISPRRSTRARRP